MSRSTGGTDATGPVNVLKMLTDHLPARHRELQAELRKLGEREQSIRAEISRLEKHAAIEGIAVGEASEPVVEPAPILEHTP